MIQPTNWSLSAFRGVGQKVGAFQSKQDASHFILFPVSPGVYKDAGESE